MKQPCEILLIVASLLMAVGCSSSRSIADKQEATGANSALSHGYGLLYELTSKQSGLGAALWIGSLSPDSTTLISDITALNKKASAQIKDFANADPQLLLTDTGLPGAETAARAATETATTKRLLFAGKQFEVRLLIAQSSATEYAASLATVIADMEKNAERKEWLLKLAEACEALRKRTEEQLKPKAP